MSEAGDRLQSFLASVPYIQFLGMRCELAGDEMTAILPSLRIWWATSCSRPCTAGDRGLPGDDGAGPAFRGPAHPEGPQDHRRHHRIPAPGRALTTYARADLRKVGRRIANVTVEAWQEARSSPIAALRGHFMLSSDE